VLVFTRKPEEAIIIGDGVEVRVLRVGKTHVRLGVVAARHVPVHRREIYDQVRRVNAAAASDSHTATEVAARLRTRAPKAAKS
jgi:carbon storage regulator